MIGEQFMSTQDKRIKTSNVSRRHFLASASASAVSIAMLQPGMALGNKAKPKISIGLIGCGGRGKWIGELFHKHGGYTVAALADYFQDKADAAGEALGVPSARRFTGLSGYKRVLEQKLDAVAIISPPYFHPEQAAAAVEAGKHIYLAKPVAVDVPGCVRIESSGRRATEKKLAFLVDFQTRPHRLYQDCAQRLHKGELGAIVSAEAAYQTGPVGQQVDAQRRADPKNQELRLRSWVTDNALSGDVITEQNIHALDMACWMLDAAPLRAYGTGGKHREFIGDCWDHFSVVYHFPKEVVLTFSSKQVGFGYEDIVCRVYGTKGSVDAHYAGKVTFKSEDDYQTGDAGNLYLSGVEANIASFGESITNGVWDNATVPASVRSNLTTILGRTAAYKQEEVSWEKMLRDAEALPADLRGLKQ